MIIKANIIIDGGNLVQPEIFESSSQKSIRIFNNDKVYHIAYEQMKDDVCHQLKQYILLNQGPVGPSYENMSLSGEITILTLNELKEIRDAMKNIKQIFHGIGLDTYLNNILLIISENIKPI